MANERRELAATEPMTPASARGWPLPIQVRHSENQDSDWRITLIETVQVPINFPRIGRVTRFGRTHIADRRLQIANLLGGLRGSLSR
jgi:hypothetical protein